MKYKKQLLFAIIAAIVLLQGVLLPFFFKGGPSGDFRTIYKQTLGLFHGQNIYAGTNPYLPAVYVVMAWSALLPCTEAWFIWRLAGLGILVCSAYWGYRHLSAQLRYAWIVFALANILMLAGFSPRSGNPGNIAAMLIVLAFLLDFEDRSVAAGVALGLATALKWALGVPFIFLSCLVGRWRTGLSALALSAVLNSVGLAVYLGHGFSVKEFFGCLAGGVWHVGGYDDSGFQRWFAADNPYRVQLLSITPTLHSFGVPPSVANIFSGLGALVFGLLSCYIALRTRNLLRASAVLAPAMLLFTYHRFYDSAILAFSVLLAWFTIKQGRVLAGTVIVLSLAFFFNVSNILLALSGSPDQLDQWWLWRYLIGPHHVYCLIALLVTATVIALRHGSYQCTDGKNVLGETKDVMVMVKV